MKFSMCAALVGVALLASAANASAQATGSVRLAITLKLHDTAELEKVIAAQTDPRSPEYAHFLTPAAFQAAYAPTQAEYHATIAALTARGFTIVRTMRDRSLVDVSASASTIAATFGSEPRVGWTPAIDPVALPYVGSISGNESVATTQQSGTAGQQFHVPSQAPTASNGRYVGSDGGYAPAALEAAENFPILHGYNGRGMTLADVIDAAPDPSIVSYLGYLGISPLPSAPTVIDVNGTPGQDTISADFDTVWLLGTAPGANLDVYAVPSLTNGNIVDALDRVVSDDAADVINLSFAACEPNPTLTDALIPIVARASALGMTIEAPDFGGLNQCALGNQFVPEIPADIPEVIAVGGSSVITSTKHAVTAESALFESGGGVSVVVPLPDEQKRIPGVNPAGRNVPDFVIASEIDGVGPTLLIYFTNVPNPNNPGAGGMLAEIAQYSGHRLGAFGRTMYRAFSTFGYGSAFEDVTRGCNGIVNAADVCAVPGYDLTSGIGSVDAMLLAELTQPSAMKRGASR